MKTETYERITDRAQNKKAGISSKPQRGDHVSVHHSSQLVNENRPISFNTHNYRVSYAAKNQTGFSGSDPIIFMIQIIELLNQHTFPPAIHSSGHTLKQLRQPWQESYFLQWSMRTPNNPYNQTSASINVTKYLLLSHSLNRPQRKYHQISQYHPIIYSTHSTQTANSHISKQHWNHQENRTQQFAQNFQTMRHRYHQQPSHSTSIKVFGMIWSMTVLPTAFSRLSATKQSWNGRHEDNLKKEEKPKKASTLL